MNSLQKKALEEAIRLIQHLARVECIPAGWVTKVDLDALRRSQRKALASNQRDLKAAVNWVHAAMKDERLTDNLPSICCPICRRILPTDWQGRCYLCEERKKEREESTSSDDKQNQQP